MSTGSLFRYPTSIAHSSRVPRREQPEVKAAASFFFWESEALIILASLHSTLCKVALWCLLLFILDADCIFLPGPCSLPLFCVEPKF